MNRLTRIVALALALAALRPLSALADSPAQRQWVLAVAKATGLGGEAFVSSLRIVNPSAQAANVDLTYLPQSPIDGTSSAQGDNSGRTPVSVTVGAGQTLAIEDVAGSKFGSSAPFGISAGGIQVDSDVPVSVLSRTFVANAKSATGVAGTFGFSIPAQIEAQAIAAGDTGYIPYISASPSTSSGFRSNFIMLNVARAGLTPIASVLHVKLVRGDGSLVGERDYTLGKLSAAQQGNIAASFGATTADTNLTLVATIKSGGPVVIGTSIIDNAISSLNYAPPTKVARPAGTFGLVFPGDSFDLAGRLDVENGVPTYMSATVVLTGCSGSAIVAFVMQAFTEPGLINSQFTKNADGTFALAGSSPEASWSGTVRYEVDGSVSGSLTYTRASGSAGGVCAGIGKTLSFVGTRAAPTP